MQGALGLTDWDNFEFLFRPVTLPGVQRFCMQELCLFFFFFWLRCVNIT